MPDVEKRLYVSVDPKTKLEAVARQLCKVIDPIGENAFSDYSLIEVDEMRMAGIESSVSEAGLSNGSRLLFLKRDC